MSGYRDDRAALKKRNEELEGEVAALRAQLATREQDDAPEPLVTGEAERPLPMGLVVVGVFAFTAAAWMAAGPIVGTELTLILIVASIIVAVLSRLFVVPGPHEAVVVSGTSDARLRIARRPLVRVPFLHATHPLELTARLVPIRIDNAYTKGGVPVHLHGHAIVGIDSEEPAIRRATERFLGNPDLEKVAAQTLAAVARELVATLTPEELSLERKNVTEKLRSEAADDMAKLGLTILDLGIETVGDGVGYLDGLPRARIAEALRAAETLDHERRTS